ncbi:MAG: PGF-CTERM sorting domain-containing protein [Halobacteria archaeon]
MAAATVAVANTADRPDSSNVFDPKTSDGNVGSGATVFQGEEGINYTLGLSTLETKSGDTLEVDRSTVPKGQGIGKYWQDPDNDSGSVSGQGDNISVVQPTVTPVDLINVNGDDISSGAEVKENEILLVRANPNYLKAEDVKIDIKGPEGGLDLEKAIVQSADIGKLTTEQNSSIRQSEGWSSRNLSNTTSIEQGIGKTNLTDSDSVIWALDFDGEDQGQYSITVEGIDDFETENNPVDQATTTKTIQLTTDDQPQIEIDNAEPTQGQKVTYTISSVSAGDNYTVAIDKSDVRDSIGTNETFARHNVLRFIGEVNSEPKVGSDFIWANLTVDEDSGIAQGQVDTQYLDDSSVDLTLLANNTTSEKGSINPNQTDNVDNHEIDETSINVNEGQITITTPGNTYVPGQEIDLNGTASQGMDDVVVYTKDQGRWQKIDKISVESDGTWEQRNVILSDSTDSNVNSSSEAASILSLPGIYRIGAVDLTDVSHLDSDGPQNLTSQQFNSGTSTQRSLRVTMPTLTGRFITYDNQLFINDDLDIVGHAVGAEKLNKFFLGTNSDTASDKITVDQDDTFEDNETVSGVSSGMVDALVMSPGRDSLYGNGVLTVSDQFNDTSNHDGSDFTTFGSENPQANVDNFENYVQGLGSYTASSYTLSQLRGNVLAESVNDQGSDDLMISKTFRLMDDSTTSVDHVAPDQLMDNTTGIVPIEPGETMGIMGTTNRNPEQATIVVEAINGTDQNLLDIGVVDEWGTSGEWSTNLSVPENVTPGNYTFQADDGETTDVFSVPVVAERSGTGGQSDQVKKLEKQVNQLQEQVDQLQGQNKKLEGQVSDLQNKNQNLTSQNKQLQDELDKAKKDKGTDNDTGGQGQGQPGFTAVVALVAILSVGAVALRRRD